MDNENANTDCSDYEEIVEESLIQVVMDDADELSNVNVNSNVRLIAPESETPTLEIENKVYHFNKWKYITGTAMFFEQLNDAKTIDPLHDNKYYDLQYVGSTRKSLEMTKKENSL